jgi:pyruvate formate lyase activating enzyme
MIVKDPLVDVDKDGTIHCKVCARRCTIPKGGTGFCGIRKNIDGKLDLIVYGRPAALGVDPIEKKPQFHFLPGTTAYSLGTYGCTFMCKFCCNWQLAQAIRERLPLDAWMDLPPEKAVMNAKLNGCASMAYTYNEPAIWYEYHRDMGKLAIRNELFNVLVTDGYGTQEFWEKASEYIHATSIDLKGFTERVYNQLTTAKLEPVLDSIKNAKKLKGRKKVWVEITSLVIPEWSDSEEEIKQEAEWLKDIDPEMPLHLIGFYPSYKMMETPPTTAEKLFSLREIAIDVGLKYVYVGNVQTEGGENTYCPNCGALLIRRAWFYSKIEDAFDIEKSKCKNCGQKIAGVWTKEQAKKLKEI